jgi:hypothetical protein
MDGAAAAGVADREICLDEIPGFAELKDVVGQDHGFERRRRRKGRARQVLEEISGGNVQKPGAAVEAAGRHAVDGPTDQRRRQDPKNGAATTRTAGRKSGAC